MVLTALQIVNTPGYYSLIMHKLIEHVLILRWTYVIVGPEDCQVTAQAEANIAHINCLEFLSGGACLVRNFADEELGAGGKKHRITCIFFLV